MPLNTGWVPVKACRLQDWEKLKKYVPIHKQGDVCPNGVPACVERGNNDDDLDSEKSVVPRALPCAPSTLQLHLLKNVIIYPPP